MQYTLKNNAYNILGLDIMASERDILKRSKEIINRLKIDDVPQYDFDIKFFENFRTEESVKESIQKLQTPKKQIRECFFWFQFTDINDKEVLELIRQKNFSNSIRIWQNASEGNSIKAFRYKKNLAILYSLLLTLEDNDQYLRESIALWKGLVDSEKFWSAFEKIYTSHNEQTASDEVLSDFKKQVVGYLSDMYTEFYQLHKDTAYINDFQKVFQSRGEKIDKNILTPAYQAINDAIEGLEKMKISEDGVLDKEESESIKKFVGNIQNELNKLIDVSLYEDSHTKTMRDRAANALKTIVLDLHNNLNETDKAISLLNIALKFVGTSSLEAEIKQDIKTLEEVKRSTDIVKPVLDLVFDKQYEQAWEIIKSDREKYKSNHELQEFYDNQTKLCISAITVQKYKKARDYFDGKQEELAKPLFIEAGQLIYDNIDLFNFNKESLDEILDEVKSKANKVNLRNIDEFDEYRNSFVKAAKEKFEGQFEETIFIILIDSRLYGGLSDFMKKIRHKSSVVNALYTVGWITVWFYGIGLIFFLAGWIYKNND
jgi:hypothetical protein